MVDKKITCPFCGKDITNDYRISRTIPQEETARREFSTRHTWAGGYLKETKYIRKFEVLCCKDCYDEYIKYEAITDKMASFAIPIGFVAGIVYTIYMRYFKNNMDFSFGADSLYYWRNPWSICIFNTYNDCKSCTSQESIL